MQGRGRIAWRGEAGYARSFPAPRRLKLRSAQATGRTPPRKLAGCRKPAAAQVPTPQTSDSLLDGFCADSRSEEQIALNSNGRLLFLRLADIDWLEASDNRVTLHVGRETYLLGHTLAVVAAKLPPGWCLRLSPSVLVNVRRIKTLRRLCRGEWQVLLHNGTRLTRPHDCDENLRQGAAALIHSTESPTRLRPPIRR